MEIDECLIKQWQNIGKTSQNIAKHRKTLEKHWQKINYPKTSSSNLI